MGLVVEVGCDPSLLRVIQMLHGGTSYKVRVHGGMSKVLCWNAGSEKVVLRAPFCSTSIMRL